MAPESANEKQLLWKGRTRRDRCQFAFEIVRTAGVLLTGISPFLTLQAFRWQQASKEDEYKWKRQDLAISLLRDWDEKTSDRRNRIDRLQAELQGISVAANMPPIGKDLAADIWSQVTYTEGNRTEQDRYNLRSDLISLLNYFESLSVAYYTEAANRELLDVSVGAPLRRWRKRLIEFTNYADTARNDEVWKRIPGAYSIYGIQKIRLAPTETRIAFRLSAPVTITELLS